MFGSQVCLTMLAVLQCTVCYEFRNSTTQSNPSSPNFNSTYVQTLAPTLSSVLTTDTINAPLQNPSTYWTDGLVTVVAVGPSMS